MKPTTIFKLNLLLLICFTLFSGCKNSKNVATPHSKLENYPKIIFLNYSIQKTKNDKISIQFISKKIVDGKLKGTPNQSIENGKQGDLIFSEHNKKSKITNQILIKNPLNKTIEFVDESKNIQTKNIKSKKTQFSIRLQLKNDTKYITISNFAKNEPLIKTKIN